MKKTTWALICLAAAMALVPAALAWPFAAPIGQGSTPERLTPEALAAMVGTFFSLVALFAPGVNTWFYGLKKEEQQALMAGLTVLAGVAIYVLACTPEIGFPFVTCPTGGIWELLTIILAALVPNQTVYRAIPEPQAVKAAKAAKAANPYRARP